MIDATTQPHFHVWIMNQSRTVAIGETMMTSQATAYRRAKTLCDDPDRRYVLKCRNPNCEETIKEESKTEG